MEAKKKKICKKIQSVDTKNSKSDYMKRKGR